jgi:N6-adenosine-specific RNA methylase IME4
MDPDRQREIAARIADGSAQSVKDAQREILKEEREVRVANVLASPSNGDGRYRTLVIDPPWPVQKILRDERPNQDAFDYPTMTLSEIVSLPVDDLADADGCHVYLWVTQKHLPSGLWLFNQWGVRYECLMTWRKNVGFTPFSWMYSTEHVLFGRIGNLGVVRKGLRLDFEAKVTRHSAKPDAFYERVVQASPEPRLELFARAKRPGFQVWGNEV